MVADVTYNTKIQQRNGGDLLAVASGGTLEIETGGVLSLNGVDVTPELALLNGVTATGAQINAAVAGTPLVYRTTVLAAAINTGTASFVVPAVAGKRFQVMHIAMAATLGGGNVTGPTTVEVKEETAGTVFLSHVTADLTDGTWHNLVTGTPVITGITAGGMTSADNKGLLVTCTGGTPYATSTGLDVIVVGYYTTT
jgi:hypothetical protein